MSTQKIIDKVFSTPRLAHVANEIVDTFLYSNSKGLDNLQEVLDVLDAAKDKLIFLRTKSQKDVESLRSN